MKETPILFKPEKIRWIFEDRASQTRRLIKMYHKKWCPWAYNEDDNSGYEWVEADPCFSGHDYRQPCRCITCPYGRKGDLLWVKEGFAELACNEIGQIVFGGPYIPPRTFVIYKADEKNPRDYLWKSPLFMPKKYARIWLELVADPIPQRIQDITEEDIGKEIPLEQSGNFKGMFKTDEGFMSPFYAFELLWESINGKDSWKKNEWVWKLEFKKIEP